MFVKKIHICLLLLCLALPWGILAEEEAMVVPISPHLMDSQWEIERLILEQYRRELYDLESPLVVVDPYGWSPLTALVLFESPEKAKVSISVLGREGAVSLSHDYENLNTFHQIPVVGLYGDYDNQVEMTLTYEDGRQERNLLTIPTQAVETTGCPTWYDETGALRWVLQHHNDQYFGRISNGNLVVLKENYDGFYEMDLLGKLFGDYYSSNRMESPIVELPSGNFLVCVDQIYSTQDRILELERGTGEIVQDLDLQSLFSPETDHHGVDGDWYQLESMEFNEKNHSLWLYSRSHGTAEIGYPGGEILQEIRQPYLGEVLGDLYPSFWEFELLTNKGKIMAKNQQDKLQTKANYTVGEGLSYDVLESGDVSYLRNESLQSLEVFANLDYWALSQAFLIFQGEETYGLRLEEVEHPDFQFALSLDYENICENIAQGDYSLGILLLTEEERVYLPSGYEYTVNRQRQSLETTDILEIQGEISDNLLKTFLAGDYTMENPMIVVNPYGNTPLSALVCFRTEEKGMLDITFGDGRIQSFFPITEQHFLPIYGLLPGVDNEIQLQFTSERGERQTGSFVVTTEELPQRVQNAWVAVAQEIPDDFTFVSGSGLTAYDGTGTVRWYCDMVEDSPILRLENGNFLIHSDKIHRTGESVSSLYEIDLLGRVYHEYVVNGAHHQVQELRNGDLFVMAERTSGRETSLGTMSSETCLDYLVVLDRETGEIVQEWDIGGLLEPSRALLAYTISGYEAYEASGAEGLSAVEWTELYGNYDWFHNNAVYYDEESEQITVSGQHQDVIFQFDGDTAEISWVMGKDGEFWQEDFYLDYGTSFYGQSYFTFLADGTMMVLDNGLYRDGILSEEPFSARILIYDLEKETAQVYYSYTAASDMGDIHQLGDQHFLFHFNGISGEEGLESHILELKDGEERFLLVIEGGSDYSARLPLYEEQATYHNLSYETSRLGKGMVTRFSSLSLPLATDAVDFTVTLAVDQGDRVGIQISCHNYPHSQKYLVLDDGVEVRCYPMESEEIRYINKSGVPAGNYVVGVYVLGDDAAYTTSGYYVNFTGEEAFSPLVSAVAEEPLYETRQVVGASLIIMLLIWLPTQFVRPRKKK